MAFGIPNIEREISNFIEGDSGITGIRQVNWGKNFLWTIKFGEVGEALVPEPFDEYFPASKVTVPMGVVEQMSFPTAGGEQVFAKGSKSKELSITFYDDEKASLLKWITDWMEYDINNEGWGISGMDDTHIPTDGTRELPDRVSGSPRAVKPWRVVELVLLNSWKKVAYRKKLKVFPVGEIAFDGGNESGANEYTVNFVVYDDMKYAGNSNNELGFFNEVKNVLGRFL